MGDRQPAQLDPRTRVFLEGMRIVVIQILRVIEEYLGFKPTV